MSRPSLIPSASLLVFLSACGAPPPVESTDAASATHQSLAAIAISGTWARETAPGVRIAAGYMTLRNDGDAPRTLVAVSSPRAARVEMHTMSMDGEIMRMRKIPSIELPAHGAALLAPGGNHLMFIDIDRPFAKGEAIPVTLAFSDASQMDVSLTVRDRATAGEDPHAGH